MMDVEKDQPTSWCGGMCRKLSTLAAGARGAEGSGVFGKYLVFGIQSVG